jgi:hypothetical protein
MCTNPSRPQVGLFGNAYLKRALLAILGMGANPPEDAIYPFALAEPDGTPFTGERDYVLHFDQAELPPVGAFWSIAWARCVASAASIASRGVGEEHQPSPGTAHPAVVAGGRRRDRQLRQRRPRAGPAGSGVPRHRRHGRRSRLPSRTSPI